MLTPELACLDLQECGELPPGTLVAPLSVLRDIRCALGPTSLNLWLGDREQVLVSSDLYEAFQAWEASQEGEAEENGGEDQSWLN